MLQSFFSCLAGLTAGVPSRQKQGRLSVSLSVMEPDRETDRKWMKRFACQIMGTKVCRTKLQALWHCSTSAPIRKCWSPKMSHLSSHNRHVCRLCCCKALSSFHLSSSPRLRSPLSLPACGSRSILAHVLLHLQLVSQRSWAETQMCKRIFTFIPFLLVYVPPRGATVL